MAGRLLLFLFVSATLGHAPFQSGQRLKPRLQRDRRNIRPNIILILTDDQDLELGSMQAMNKTRRIMEEGGTSFSNAFVTTPMCCPSRSSMLTGKYVHNHNTYTNNENCSSMSWQRQHEPRTFGVYLNNTGYRTDKHWIMRYTGAMKPIHMEFTNMLQRKRLQTLLSVDDSMEKLYNMLVETGELENTYIIYTSDHGYHIGQFGLVKAEGVNCALEGRDRSEMKSEVLLALLVECFLRDRASGDVISSSLKTKGQRREETRRSEREHHRYVPSKQKAEGVERLFSGGEREAAPPTCRGKGSDTGGELPAQIPTSQRLVSESRVPDAVSADRTGKLRLFKCKNEGGGAKSLQRGVAGLQRPISIKSQLYQRNSDACDCDFRELRPPNLRPSMLRPFNKKPFFSKKKFKALKSYSRNRFTRSVSMTNSYPGNRSHSDESDDEYSGMGGVPGVVALPNSIKITHRCSILSNASVKCDTGVYQSLQAWKDHKLHIDHEIETLQTKIKNLREVRGHLKKARPLECDCNKYLYKSKLKNKLRLQGGGMHPFSGFLLRVHQCQQQHILVSKDRQRDPQLPVLRLRQKQTDKSFNLSFTDDRATFVLTLVTDHSSHDATRLNDKNILE
ncbi:hypothetical protein F2P81_011369 [Scophthalmus maximus]|uniref:Extracellular sulfatase n=1 Tax=Scophthalmus maximus TaxID=52904 RepID=A0A6A4SRM8_SCOMX|nr:hypothetical protein F2P81_011369 [Scophthalmus maximus]